MECGIKCRGGFHTKKIFAGFLALCIAISLAGCSGGNDNSTPTANNGGGSENTKTETPDDRIVETGDELKDFLAEVAGIWYCHANLSGATLEVREDAVWIHTESGVSSDGVVMYSEENGFSFAVVGTSGTAHYTTFPVENGVLIFKSHPYYLEDDSIDLAAQFNGRWFLNGDKDSDLFEFSDGNWRFTDNTNDFSYTVKTGYLSWNAAKGELEAYEYYDEPPFAVFTGSDNTLTKDSDSYERLEDSDVNGV